VTPARVVARDTQVSTAKLREVAKAAMESFSASKGTVPFSSSYVCVSATRPFADLASARDNTLAAVFQSTPLLLLIWNTFCTSLLAQGTMLPVVTLICGGREAQERNAWQPTLACE